MSATRTVDREPSARNHRASLKARGPRGAFPLETTDLPGSPATTAVEFMMTSKSYPRDMPWLRPQHSRSALAGRCADRRPVRRQLRGGRREQHPPRRCGLRGVPVRDRRRGGVAGPAPHEHGVDLRIRLARRLLARCSACSPSAQLPVTVFGVATALARNPDAVAAMKEAGWEIATHGLKWIEYKDFHRGRGAPAHREGDPHPHRGDRRASARLVSGPNARMNTRRSCMEEGGFLYSVRHPTPTTCPIGWTGRAVPTSSFPIRSTPTTCASPRRRASTAATSSSPT